MSTWMMIRTMIGLGLPACPRRERLRHSHAGGFAPPPAAPAHRALPRPASLLIARPSRDGGQGRGHVGLDAVKARRPLKRVDVHEQLLVYLDHDALDARGGIAVARGYLSATLGIID